MDAAMPEVFALHETFDERARRDLIKLVRKLRWMGKEDEAQELARAMSRRGIACVAAGSGETD